MERQKDKYDISFTSTTAKMPMKDKWIHAIHTGFAFQVSWVIFAYYLMYFFTDVFGISAGLAGTLVLWIRVFDTFTDAMIGVGIDNCYFRWGKYRSWQIFSVIPMTITFVMIFTAIDTDSTALKIIWVCISYGLFSPFGATCQFSPTTAQLSNMTKNPDERNYVAAIKGAGINVAQIVAAVLFIRMVQTFGGDDEAKGFFFAALVVALVVGVVCIANIVISKKYELNRDGSYREHLRKPAEVYPLWDQIKDLFKIRPIVVVSINNIFQQTLYAVRSGMLIYIFQYLWNLSDFYEMAILQYTIGMVLGALLLKPATKWIGDTNRCFIIAKVATGVLFIANYFVIVGMDVEASAASMQYGIVWVLFVLSGVALGMEAVVAFALLPGMVDYGEYITGKNKGGFIHSMFGVTMGLGGALGGFVLGVLLENSGYVANAVQSQNTLDNMLILGFIIPAILVLISAVIQCFYGVNDKKLAVAVEEIAKRRETQKQDSEVL